MNGLMGYEVVTRDVGFDGMRYEAITCWEETFTWFCSVQTKSA